MRTISATLLAEQNKDSNTPYIRLVFTSPDGTVEHDYSSNTGRLVKLEHVEEAYNDYATVILANDDCGVASDLRGFWVEIGYGYIMPVTEYSPASRLWVKSHMEFMAEGKKYVMLDLGGVWDVLRETLDLREGTPPYYMFTEDESGGTYYASGLTVYYMIQYVLDSCNDDNYDFFVAALGAEDDGIIDSFIPKFEVNVMNQIESAIDIIVRLMEMTKCYLRPRATGVAANIAFQVVYPQDSDAADITYSDTTPPLFYEYLEKTNILIPNHIIVYANEGDPANPWAEYILAEVPSITRNNSLDQEAQSMIDAYRDVIEIQTAALIDNLTDAQNRADAIWTKRKAYQLAGRLVAKNDCRLEIYDRISVVSSKGCAIPNN